MVECRYCGEVLVFAGKKGWKHLGDTALDVAGCGLLLKAKRKLEPAAQPVRVPLKDANPPAPDDLEEQVKLGIHTVTSLAEKYKMPKAHVKRWLKESDLSDLAEIAWTLKSAKIAAGVEDLLDGDGPYNVSVFSRSLRVEPRTLKRVMAEHGLVIVRIPKHGTPNEYGRWKCRCDDCVLSNTERKALWLSARSVRLDEAPHGTPSGYKNWGCRCDDCSDAASVATGGTVSKRWTEAEDALLRSGYAVSAELMAETMGRSVVSIYQRRRHLKRQREMADA